MGCSYSRRHSATHRFRRSVAAGAGRRILLLSQVRQQIDLSVRSTQPIVSPNGKRVLYIKLIEQGKNEELWVSDIHGQNPVKLASAVGIGTGLWSPDSSHVSFFATEKKGENNKGYVIGADGSDLVPIESMGENISNISWAADGKTLYVTSLNQSARPAIWKVNSDGTKPEKFLENCYAMESTPDGKYLLGVILSGKETGIYQVSLADKKRIQLLPGVTTFMIRMSSDHQAFLYPVAGRGEILFYRQEWKDGELIGKPKVALKLPFAFPFGFFGNAYDFSPDLSTVVYAKPRGQADLYFLTY
jgi:dipeptidyl aminopeptidase/acylaminoacyl peptidase